MDLEKEKKGHCILRPSCPVLTSSVRSKNHTNTNLWKPFPTLWPITCKTEWKKHIFIEGNKKKTTKLMWLQKWTHSHIDQNQLVTFKLRLNESQHTCFHLKCLWWNPNIFFGFFFWRVLSSPRSFLYSGIASRDIKDSLCFVVMFTHN